MFFLALDAFLHFFQGHASANKAGSDASANGSGGRVNSLESTRKLVVLLLASLCHQQTTPSIKERYPKQRYPNHATYPQVGVVSRKSQAPKPAQQLVRHYCCVFPCAGHISPLFFQGEVYFSVAQTQPFNLLVVLAGSTFLVRVPQKNDHLLSPGLGKREIFICNWSRGRVAVPSRRSSGRRVMLFSLVLAIFLPFFSKGRYILFLISSFPSFRIFVPHFSIFPSCTGVPRGTTPWAAPRAPPWRWPWAWCPWPWARTGAAPSASPRPGRAPLGAEGRGSRRGVGWGGGGVGWWGSGGVGGWGGERGGAAARKKVR